MEITKHHSTKKWQGLLLIGIVLALCAVPLALADSHLPPAILKIKEYNKQHTQDFALKVSFFIAFVAGMLGIFSPCILPFLPVYFSYTFKEKKNITFMTLIFFAGFSLAFVTMGIIAGLLGQTLLSGVQNPWLGTVAGLFIISMGVLSILGKGFSSLISANKKFSHDTFGTFLFGLFFAVGWSACLGPILSGVLGIGALLHDPLNAGLLLFAYSLGNFIPLFILSVFYDKLNIANSKFIKGKMLSLSLFGKSWEVHSTNLIAGILFIFIGGIMVIFKSTEIFNTLDIFKTRDYFYLFQNKLLGWQYANITGIVVLGISLAIIGITLWTSARKKADEDKK